MSSHVEIDVQVCRVPQLLTLRSASTANSKDSLSHLAKQKVIQNSELAAGDCLIARSSLDAKDVFCCNVDSPIVPEIRTQAANTVFPSTPLDRSLSQRVTTSVLASIAKLAGVSVEPCEVDGCEVALAYVSGKEVRKADDEKEASLIETLDGNIEKWRRPVRWPLKISELQKFLGTCDSQQLRGNVSARGKQGKAKARRLRSPTPTRFESGFMSSSSSSGSSSETDSSGSEYSDNDKDSAKQEEGGESAEALFETTERHAGRDRSRAQLLEISPGAEAKETFVPELDLRNVRFRILVRHAVSVARGQSPVLQAVHAERNDAYIADGSPSSGPLSAPTDSTADTMLVDIWQRLNHQIDALIESEYEALLELEYKLFQLKRKREPRGLKASRISTGHPYRDSRVRIDPLPHGLGGHGRDATFIDASFCWGGRYVAASFPQTDVQREDFWRMILDHDIRVIVMLNDERERQGQQYWPNKITLPVLSHSSSQSGSSQDGAAENRSEQSDRKRAVTLGTTRSALRRVRSEAAGVLSRPTVADPAVSAEPRTGGAAQWFSIARIMAVERTLQDLGLDEDDVQEVLASVRAKLPHKLLSRLITIEKLEQVGGGGVIMRKLRVRNNMDGRQVIVTHLQYQQWPDQGIPNPVNFNKFIQQVQQTYNSECRGIRVTRISSAKAKAAAAAKLTSWVPPHHLPPAEAAAAASTLPKPMLVHCYGGHGRTGTMLSILTALDSYKARSELDLPRVVSLLRFDRATQIENELQYKFLYEYVLSQLGKK